MSRQRHTFEVYGRDLALTGPDRATHAPARRRRQHDHARRRQPRSVHGRLTYSCVGHPPPLLLDRDSGRVTRLDRRECASDGRGGAGRRRRGGAAASRRGALVLYTDGLVERRGRGHRPRNRLPRRSGRGGAGCSTARASWRSRGRDRADRRRRRAPRRLGRRCSGSRSRWRSPPTRRCCRACGAGSKPGSCTARSTRGRHRRRRPRRQRSLQQRDRARLRRQRRRAGQRQPSPEDGRDASRRGRGPRDLARPMLRARSEAVA